MKRFVLSLFLVVACGGKSAGDDPNAQSSAASAGQADRCASGNCSPQPGDCPMSMCSDWDTACAYGRPIHFRCIPQHGGSAEGTCELVSDCSSEFAGSPPPERVCAASECASNAIGCVVGSPQDVTCVKDTPTSEYCHADYACR